MKPEDIGALVSASDPRLSPDGSTVAFVVTSLDLDANQYRSRVWVAATDASSPPRPLTAGDREDQSPRWASDGRSLAFVSHRQEHGTTIHVMPTQAAGEVATVATWAEDIDALAWSPDGTELAFVARHRDEERYGKEKEKDQPPRWIDTVMFRHDSIGWTVDRRPQVFVVPADGSAKPRALTDGPFEHSGLTWSPDGQAVITAAGRHGTWDLDLAVDLFRVPLDGGEPERLTPTGMDNSLPSWSPDGTTVAFLQTSSFDDPRHAEVAVLPLDGSGPARVLTASLDRNCAPYPPPREPIWAGDNLLFGVEDSGNTALYRVGRDGSGPVLVVGGERQVTGWDVAGGVIVFCATAPTALPEVFVLRPDGTEQQLTSVGRAFVAGRELSAPERFLAPSPGGGEVEAWVMRPVGFEEGRRYPVLVNVHGGPFTQYGNTLFDEFQLQAGAGYAVVYCNPRGSSGYSEAWGRAIRGPKAEVDPGTGWGGADYEDVMAVVDEALARFDFLDPDRLGVLGGSYGGYMASWIIGHTDRFRAACSERAVNNLLTEDHTADYPAGLRGHIGVSHLEDPQEYLRQSPVTYVRDFNTPLLIVHSEQDLRCPVNQAEELFVALRLLGKPVEFVRFPGESHELSRSGSPRHRVQRAEIILDFFARHLAPPS